MGADVSCGQTDGRIERNDETIVAFRNFANAPKKLQGKE